MESLDREVARTVSCYTYIMQELKARVMRIVSLYKGVETDSGPSILVSA